MESQHIENFATELYSGGFITRETLNNWSKKSGSSELLLSAVESQIKITPKKFHEFLDILRQEPAMDGICQMLRVEYLYNLSMRLKIIEQKCEFKRDGHCEVCVTLSLVDDEREDEVQLFLTLVDSTLPHIQATIFGVIACQCQNEVEIVHSDSIRPGSLNITLKVFKCNPQSSLKFELLHLTDREGEILANSSILKCCTAELPLQSMTTSCVPEKPMENFKEYTGHLIGKTWRASCQHFREAIMENDTLQMKVLTKSIKENQKHKNDFKAYFVCYHALHLVHVGQYLQAESVLIEAFEMTQQTENNSHRDLIVGRISRIRATMYRTTGEFDKALQYVEECKRALEYAKPSCEMACAFTAEAFIIQNKCRDGLTPDQCTQVKNLLVDAYRCANQCNDAGRRVCMLPMIYIDMALFHLRSFQKITPLAREERNLTTSLWVSLGKSDLDMAMDYLRRAESTKLEGKNIYQIRRCVAYSDLYRHRGDHSKAAEYIKMAKELQDSSKSNEHHLGIDEKYLFLLKKLS